ncbi:MAG TPA: acyl-CoA dehydrogenase family protein [Candidatus Binataceae bacterium]|nr:acyl-CoA dehydrogenase family protein [Candidatus Binataceae bacterium]
MICPAGVALPQDPPILHRAIELGPAIREASEEIEHGRRLPVHIAQAMKQAGIFGMVIPREWGGPELDPLTQLRIIEALAMAEGSVGWCAMIGCDSGYVTAFLDQDVARAMYPDIWVATAATVTISGQAVVAPGGYRVSGRFPFASGCQHCEWLWAGCQVIDNGAQRIDANGIPETRTVFVKLAQCEILDTWYTTGLRGTGSHDIAIQDVFVPAEQTFSFADPQLIKRPGPLYAFPLMFIAKGAAPALGVTRRAIDILLETVGRKPSRKMMLSDRVEPPRLLRDEVFVQEVAGRAETMLGAARAYLFDVIGDLWATLVDGRRPSPVQEARFIAAYGYVVGLCVEAVQLVFKASGGSAVYQNGPLDRCMRDVLTMNQHLMGSLKTYEMAGRLLFGLEPLRWMF